MTLLKAFCLKIAWLGINSISTALGIVSLVCLLIYTSIPLGILLYVAVAIASSFYFIFSKIERTYITHLDSAEVDPDNQKESYIIKNNDCFKLVLLADGTYERIFLNEYKWCHGKEYIVCIPKFWNTKHKAKTIAPVQLSFFADVNGKEATAWISIDIVFFQRITNDFIMELFEIETESSGREITRINLNDVLYKLTEVVPDKDTEINQLIEDYISGQLTHVDLILALREYVLLHDVFSLYAHINTDIEESILTSIEINDCEDDEDESLSIAPDGTIVHQDNDDE